MFDDSTRRMKFDYPFDVDLLVPGKNDEAARLVPQLLVGRDRKLDPFATGRAEAFAHDFDLLVAPELEQLRADRMNALVDFAIDHLDRSRVRHERNVGHSSEDKAPGSTRHPRMGPRRRRL
jgi:hypothetical protein